MSGWDVASNVIANVLTALLAVTAGYLTFFVSEWRGLLGFFGIRKGMVDLRIYLSRVEITSPGSTRKFAHYAMDDNRGPLIGLTELEAALLIQRKLRSRIALAYFPQAVTEWLRQRISFLAVEPKIEICPRHPTDIAEDNLVVLGSGTYNPIAQHFFETQKLFFEFDIDDRGHLKARRNDKKLEISGRTDGKDLCLLQRVTLREEDGALDRRVFICWRPVGSGLSFRAKNEALTPLCGYKAIWLSRLPWALGVFWGHLRALRQAYESVKRTRQSVNDSTAGRNGARKSFIDESRGS
jgi:hypothetical protein